jgi:hypothetical protein
MPTTAAGVLTAIQVKHRDRECIGGINFSEKKTACRRF